MAEETAPPTVREEVVPRFSHTHWQAEGGEQDWQVSHHLEGRGKFASCQANHMFIMWVLMVTKGIKNKRWRVGGDVFHLRCGRKPHRASLSYITFLFFWAFYSFAMGFIFKTLRFCARFLAFRYQMADSREECFTKWVSRSLNNQTTTLWHG